jgi:hypothetical protein
VQYTQRLCRSAIDAVARDVARLDQVMTTAEASELTGVRVGTMQACRSHRGGPHLKAGGSACYRRRMRLDWMAEHERRNTTDRGAGHG